MGDTNRKVREFHINIFDADVVDRHIHKGRMSYFVYHGSAKNKVSDLTNYDVVLTTYDTIMAEEGKRVAKNSVRKHLRNVDWCRIVLDEG